VKKKEKKRKRTDVKVGRWRRKAGKGRRTEGERVRQDRRDDRRKKKIPNQGHDVGRAARINACATVILCPPSISLLPSFVYGGMQYGGSGYSGFRALPLKDQVAPQGSRHRGRKKRRKREKKKNKSINESESYAGESQGRIRLTEETEDYERSETPTETTTSLSRPSQRITRVTVIRCPLALVDAKERALLACILDSESGVMYK